MPALPLFAYVRRRVVLAALLVVACGGNALPTPARAQLSFLPMYTRDLPSVAHSALAWGDYDASGTFDLLMAGQRRDSLLQSKLFANRGDTTYTGPGGVLIHETQYRLAHVQIAPLSRAAASWGDYDASGELDFAVMGQTRAQRPATLVYQQTNGRFSRAATLAPGLQDGDLAWGDYDNDGDADLLVAGADAEGHPRSLIYENENGSFTARDVGLTGVKYGSVDWGDYDTDGDLDVLLSGATAAQRFVAKVYRNDGAGAFTAVQARLQGLAFSSADWGDYDADGDPDVLLSGGVLSPFMLRGTVKVYENLGGSFSDRKVALPGGYHGGASWGDYDGDGRLDILSVGGSAPVRVKTGVIYRNRQNGAFTRLESFLGLVFGDAEFADYDNDDDLDVITSGRKGPDEFTAAEYRNELNTGNTPPSAPSSLQASTDGNAVTLSWTASTDAQTPAAGLSYNLRVGAAPGRGDVMAPLAAPDSGYRYVARPGNAGQNTSWTVRDLEPGTYYWSVQAVDNSYKGSPFASEGRFVIEEP